MTRIAEAQLGSSSRNRMWKRLAPSVRAASTNSWWRSVRVIEKISRVCQVHQSAAIASIAWMRLGVSTAVTASAITSGGIASAMSVRRMMTISAQPPK